VREWLYVGQDITKEKEISEMKSEFVSMVSHELRSPLTSIREAVSQVYQGLLGDLNEEQKEFLRISMEESNRLGMIVNELLDISKIEAGKVEVRKTLMDMAHIAKRCVAAFQSMTKKKGIKIRTEFSDQEIPVFADPTKIQQILNNLISNATHAKP